MTSCDIVSHSFHWFPKLNVQEAPPEGPKPVEEEEEVMTLAKKGYPWLSVQTQAPQSVHVSQQQTDLWDSDHYPKPFITKTKYALRVQVPK